jgi:hypothetical protein
MAPLISARTRLGQVQQIIEAMGEHLDPDDAIDRRSKEIESDPRYWDLGTLELEIRRLLHEQKNGEKCAPGNKFITSVGTNHLTDTKRSHTIQFDWLAQVHHSSEVRNAVQNGCEQDQSGHSEWKATLGRNSNGASRKSDTDAMKTNIPSVLKQNGQLAIKCKRVSFRDQDYHVVTSIAEQTRRTPRDPEADENRCRPADLKADAATIISRQRDNYKQKTDQTLPADDQSVLSLFSIRYGSNHNNNGNSMSDTVMAVKADSTKMTFKKDRDRRHSSTLSRKSSASHFSRQNSDTTYNRARKNTATSQSSSPKHSGRFGGIMNSVQRYMNESNRGRNRFD